MTTTELQKRLIDKIRTNENKAQLEEVYRLLELDSEDLEIYELTNDQLKAVNESKHQIKNRQSLTDDQANKEIDGWLGH